jgi:predicted nucleic acid-binding protein
VPREPICVLDASVAVAAMIAEDRSDTARRILCDISRNSAVVPNLWFLEVGNTLLIAERRRSLKPAARRDHLADLARLPIMVDSETASQAWNDSMGLAERHRLTLHDAAYLELALRRRLPLATFDAALGRAATTAGVALL